MMRKPTEKMLSYAAFISRMTGIERSRQVFTNFDACYDFIRKNKDVAHRIYKSGNWRILERQWGDPNQVSLQRNQTEYTGGDYGVANNDTGIDCYDFGIYPWGNS